MMDRRQERVDWLDKAMRWARVLLVLAASGGVVSSLRGEGMTPEMLPEGDQGIAAKYPEDRGIGKDAAVLFHDDFEAGSPVGRWDMVYQMENIRMADEPGNRHGGKLAVEMTVPKQSAERSNALVKYLKPGYDVVFLRYYSKFEEGFDQVGSSHNGGYLAAIAPGLPYATPGIRADGKNRFVASFENWRGGAATPSPGHLNVYCYHPEQRSQWGITSSRPGLCCRSRRRRRISGRASWRGRTSSRSWGAGTA